MILLSALSANHGAGLQKKYDASSAILSQAKYSDSSFDEKLQSKIESYLRNIERRRNERRQLMKKILDRAPQKCKKINCPLQEIPVCANFFYKNKNSVPFYVRMINECEMNYMKCHRGLEATVVSMENCHSVIDDTMLSEQAGKRRSKRSVEPGPSLEALSNVNPGDLDVTDNNTILTNNKANLQFSTNHKTSNNQTMELVSAAKLNKVQKPISMLNDKFTKNVKIVPKFVGTVPIKGRIFNTKLKVGSQNLRNTKSLNVNKTVKDKSLRTHAVKRDGKQYLEKNVGKNKMFTHNVLSNTQNVNAGSGNKPSMTDDIKIDNDVIEQNEVKPTGNGDPNIVVAVEMDDAEVEKLLDMNVQNRPLDNVAVPDLTSNNDPVENMKIPNTQGNDPLVEVSMEVDDKDPDLDKDNILSNVEPKIKSSNPASKEDEIIKGEIEFDDSEIHKLNDEQGNGKKKFIQNLHREKAVIELKSEELQTFQDNSPPLVDEPPAEGDYVFHTEEDYRYVPQVIPPIVSLDVASDGKDELEVFNKADDEKPHTPSEAKSSDENIGGDVYVDANGGNVDGGGDKNSDLYPKDNDDDVPYHGDEKSSSKQNDDEEEIGKNNSAAEDAEYQAECPRRCPVRDMMVCGVCQHGIYRTFLTVCHMRMYQCKRIADERLELVSRLPCVMSAPLITEDPPMQPAGRVSEPGDLDTVLRYVRCREKGMLGKSSRCTFKNTQQLNQEVTGEAATQISPLEYY